MSVYVDDLSPWEEWMVCRMVADTAEELHELADKIGVPRWCGRAADLYPHYALIEEERAEAIKHGAIEVDTRKIVDVLNAMRPKGEAEVEAEYAEIREEAAERMDAVAELIDAAIYGSASIGPCMGGRRGGHPARIYLGFQRGGRGMTAQFTFCVQMPSGRIVAIDGHAEFDREERHWIATAGETGAKGISDDCVIACAEAVRNANGPCFLPARKEGEA